MVTKPSTAGPYKKCCGGHHTLLMVTGNHKWQQQQQMPNTACTPLHKSSASKDTVSVKGKTEVTAKKTSSWMAWAAAGLAWGMWAEKATGLLAWQERKEGQACSGSPITQANCLLIAQDARAGPSHVPKPLTQTRRAAAGRSRSSAQCGGVRPSDSSLWLVQDCHECRFPSSTTPPA